MNQPLFRLFLLALLLSACKKKDHLVCCEPDLFAKYKWVGSAMGTTLQVTPASGVEKTLEFHVNGNLTVVHNDIVQNNAFLEVGHTPTLMAAPKTESGRYTYGTQKAGCANSDYPSLQTLGATYQYSFSSSQDSLYITLDPCLAPYTTMYVRVLQ